MNATNANYLQHYGARAVEAYKRSLQHTNSANTPQPSPDRTAEKTLRRDKSRYRTHSRESKSHKSLPKKSKHTSSKSVLDQHTGKTQRNGQTGPNSFNSIHLNLGIQNPQKKKLVISSTATPKHTPVSKAIIPKTRPEKVAGISTNVNVYVQAINRSKSKQSTPARLNKSRESPRHKQPSDSELIKQMKMLVEEEQMRRDGRGLKLIKEKLGLLHCMTSKKDRKLARLEGKFERMKQVMGSTIVEHKESPDRRESRQKQLETRVGELESQLGKYQEKEKALMKIVESLSGNRQGIRWKEPSSEGPMSSEQEDDNM